MQRRNQVVTGPAADSHEAPTAAEKRARGQDMKEDTMQSRWKAVMQQAPGQAAEQHAARVARPTSHGQQPEDDDLAAAVQLPVRRASRKKPSGKATSSSSSSLPQQPQPPQQAEAAPAPGDSSQSQSDWDGLWAHMERELFEPDEHARSSSAAEGRPVLSGPADSAACAVQIDVEHVFSSQELEAELTVQLTLGGFG